MMSEVTAYNVYIMTSVVYIYGFRDKTKFMCLTWSDVSIVHSLLILMLTPYHPNHEHRLQPSSNHILMLTPYHPNHEHRLQPSSNHILMLTPYHPNHEHRLQPSSNHILMLTPYHPNHEHRLQPSSNHILMLITPPLKLIFLNTHDLLKHS